MHRGWPAISPKSSGHFLSVEFTSCLPPANMLAYQHQIVSSDQLPNARRPEPIDAEERKRRSLEKVRRYLDTPTVEDVLVNEHTKAHRKWLMGRWNKYFRDKGSIPTPYGQACAKETERRPVGPWHSSQTMSSIRRGWSWFSDLKSTRKGGWSTAQVHLLQWWRKLIKEADLTVLSAKRLEDPRNKEKWRLRFHNHNTRFPSSSISVFDVSKVDSRSFCVLTRLMFIPKVALDWPRSRSGPAPHQAHHVHEDESHRRRCSRNPPHLVRTCCRSRN